MFRYQSITSGMDRAMNVRSYSVFFLADKTWFWGIYGLSTAISMNVVGSKLQAKRQDRKVVWVVLNLSSEARQGR